MKNIKYIPCYCNSSFAEPAGDRAPFCNAYSSVYVLVGLCTVGTIAVVRVYGCTPVPVPSPTRRKLLLLQAIRTQRYVDEGICRCRYHEFHESGPASIYRWASFMERRLRCLLFCSAFQSVSILLVPVPCVGYAKIVAYPQSIYLSNSQCCGPRLTCSHCRRPREESPKLHCSLFVHMSTDDD